MQKRRDASKYSEVLLSYFPGPNLQCNCINSSETFSYFSSFLEIIRNVSVWTHLMVIQMAFQESLCRSLRSRKTHWNDLELEEGSRIKYRRCGMEGRESLKECHGGMVTLKGRRDTKGEMRKTLCILICHDPDDSVLA